MANAERAADPCTTLARLGLQMTGTTEFVVMPATARSVAARVR
jgi:hypothetical protein